MSKARDDFRKARKDLVDHCNTITDVDDRSRELNAKVHEAEAKLTKFEKATESFRHA